MLLGGCHGCMIRRRLGSDLVVVGCCYYCRKAWLMMFESEGERLPGFRFGFGRPEAYGFVSWLASCFLLDEDF